MTSRLEKIQAMLADEPDDLFLRYSLAMELRGMGELEKPLEILNSLTKEETPYVPAYFRCAQILADEQRIEEARSYLRDGIECARAQGDLHAAGEMSEMLSDLGQFGE
jgi:tetratricopeptide (TPR) repeat protein